LPNGSAVYDLSGQFGASLDEAVELLRAARPHAARLGIAFHVGSQCLEPEAYARALALAAEAIASCGVPVDIVDVGGGFPVSYPGMAPPPLGDYIAAIEAGHSVFALLGRPGATAARRRGPFRLPADMREGDWIELGQLGAYGACLRTGFNGFGRVDLVEVADPPMLATPGYDHRVTISSL